MDDSYKPWIEKYRPQDIKEVLLDDCNKTIIENIIKKEYFPNLLFYGPPGTGKTTTILNLIKEHFKKHSFSNNVIHLNASDDRGIDVIRNQIYNFVHFKQIFDNNLKFVILDEVDYMTKSAQNTLRQIIKNYENVRFCLICNYISKIIKPLQNNFLKLYFYNNEKDKIFNLLNIINQNEKLNLSDYSINILIDYYGTDIRSMINHLQIMQNTTQYSIEIMSNELFEKFVNIIDKLKNNTTDIKKIKDIELKIKTYLYNNNIMFESLYIHIMNELKKHTINPKIIENLKILYYDSLNGNDNKIKYLIHQIYIPYFNSIS
tara:strand:- start:6037 stop:6990 length:954 start_codon:yes stop_codon:yes gene_type:complete